MSLSADCHAATQLAAAAPFFSGAAHQFGLPGMLAPNLAHLTQPNGAGFSVLRLHFLYVS